jgi:hypothetical protein
MSHAGRVAADAGSSEPRAGRCCRGGRRDGASGRHSVAGLAGRHGGAAACTAGRAGRRAPGTAGQGRRGRARRCRAGQGTTVQGGGAGSGRAGRPPGKGGAGSGGRQRGARGAASSVNGERRCEARVGKETDGVVTLKN